MKSSNAAASGGELRSQPITKGIDYVRSYFFLREAAGISFVQFAFYSILFTIIAFDCFIRNKACAYRT
jgi:hypothetical protein